MRCSNATPDGISLASLMRRSPSSEWEETLDNFGALSGLLSPFATSLETPELSGLDQFLLAAADDCVESCVADLDATPDSLLFAADQAFLDEREQDFAMLLAGDFDPHAGSDELRRLMEWKLEPQVLEQPQLQSQRVLTPPTTSMTTKMTSGASVDCHRKREMAEGQRHWDEGGASCQVEKKVKRAEKELATSIASEAKTSEQTEKAYRRRYDILHGILEAWNTGGIEDLEEIAANVYDDDVTLFSPDYADCLRGVDAVMSHWSLLLDAFPDGIMEEYIIQREDGKSDKMKATWLFSGTQIFPIFGVQPRHKKVCIRGCSFFTFKDDRIRQIVLSWDYRETLQKLTGVHVDKTSSSEFSAITPAVAFRS
uniref:SnoaL-like domain-containing protein n=1 Tax=Peronospora matthiolae TaxID=2874970 RepID=A0AAV1VB96_9STRA